MNFFLNKSLHAYGKKHLKNCKIDLPRKNYYFYVSRGHLNLRYYTYTIYKTETDKFKG